MPKTTDHTRERLVQTERHLAEMKRQIGQLRQLVDGLPLESPIREDAVKMLAVLEDSLPMLEQHRELLREWLEEAK